METERAPKATTASPAASHHTPPGEPLDELALLSEARELTAAVRAHVLWLRDGGVAGLPRPARASSPPRPAPRPPAPERFSHAAEAEHLTHADYAAAALAALAEPAGPRRPPPEAPPPPAAELPESWDEPPPPEPPPGRMPSSGRMPSAPAPSSAPQVQVPMLPQSRPAPLAEAEYPELHTLDGLRGAEALTGLRTIIGDCRRCKLCHGRNKLVFGEGNPGALIAFVGEGPGAQEDLQGRPFVGEAGGILARMIKMMAKLAVEQHQRPDLAARLTPEQVYICNVVKCRPPGNRTPEPDEIASCGPFLRAQLTSLPNLRAIVALGRTPMQYLLSSTAPITKQRGTLRPWPQTGVPIMPTYHPAYLLRVSNDKWWEVRHDLETVLNLLVEQVPPPSP